MGCIAPSEDCPANIGGVPKHLKRRPEGYAPDPTTNCNPNNFPYHLATTTMASMEKGSLEIQKQRRSDELIGGDANRALHLRHHLAAVK